MDTFEIMSTVRNYSGLETPQNIGDPLLRRLCNLGMQYVAQSLIVLYRQFLVRTLELSSQSGAFVNVPGDMLSLINVEREDPDSIMRNCNRVEVEDKGLIGKNVNMPGTDEQYPCYVHEGREIYIWPLLSSDDVNVRYRRCIADLADGILTYASATTGVLGGNASPEDDYYNNYDFAVYTVTGASKLLMGIYKVTDYAGATKTATFEGITLAASGTVYNYALVPIVPEEFHNLIVDASMIELKKAHKFEDTTSWQEDFTSLNTRIEMILKTNGPARAA